ncbi:MAG: DUF2244 domain-containing protein, partial [Pseudomonadota bacterium]
MLTSESNSTTNSTRFVVRPNASLSRRGLICFFGGITLVSLTISLRFWLLGAWMILPLALVELSLLGFCLRHTLRNSARRQSIDLVDGQITVTNQGYAQRQSLSFPAFWARVEERRGTYRWYPSRLFLRSHGRR